eukprot:364876-Chlamydomonas_euryale.AAC.6
MGIASSCPPAFSHARSNLQCPPTSHPLQLAWCRRQALPPRAFLPCPSPKQTPWPALLRLPTLSSTLLPCSDCNNRHRPSCRHSACKLLTSLPLPNPPLPATYGALLDQQSSHIPHPHIMPRGLRPQ